MHQQIRGSYRAPPATWDDVLRFLEANQDLMRGLISHRFSLTEALEGFELAHNRVASKVMLTIGDAP